MKINRYVVDASIPLPPSFSGISKEEYKAATSLRRKVAEATGIKVVLTGQSTANPNYKFDKVFKSEASARKLAALANKITGNPNFSEVIDISYEL